MAQHDYNIANNPGSTVRADINALAEAIATLNGGSSAPSVTFAHMFWFDEANTLLKVRNAANSGWITLGSIGASNYQYLGDPIAYAQGGTAATTNYGASDNLAATGYIDVASGGTTNIGAAASQKVRITGTTTITAFDTVAAGIERQLYFAGALQLTYNATSMQLPGGLNITTRAGDQAKAISLGSGNWRIVNFQPAVSPNLGYRYIGTQTITATGTYTPTPGTRAIRVRMCGAGGGGGGADNSDADSALGAGGGGGGETIEFFMSMVGIASVSCTLAAAGTAGANTGGDGGDGGDTSFGAYAVAKGGKGGKGFSSAFFEGYPGGEGGFGGTVPSGGISIVGQPGHNGSGRYGGGASADAANGGQGGSSTLGGGGLGGRSFGDSQPGIVARGYGGGGGGAACSGTTSGDAGGAGKIGVIYIEEFA